MSVKKLHALLRRWYSIKESETKTGQVSKSESWHDVTNRKNARAAARSNISSWNRCVRHICLFHSVPNCIGRFARALHAMPPAANTDPTAGFIVVQIHQHATERSRVSRIILLTLASVDEHHREPVAVVGVVSAAAPDPVGCELGRARSGAAAARCHVAVSARSCHAVQNPGWHHRLPERRFRTPCNIQRHRVTLWICLS